jgi:hypothetical protein
MTSVHVQSSTRRPGPVLLGIVRDIEDSRDNRYVPMVTNHLDIMLPRSKSIGLPIWVRLP